MGKKIEQVFIIFLDVSDLSQAVSKQSKMGSRPVCLDKPKLDI